MKVKAKITSSLHSDAAAEEFVASADLSQHDLSGFKPMSFKIKPKSDALHMCLPLSSHYSNPSKPGLKAKGVPYTRYVRMLLETDISSSTDTSW